MHIPMHRGFYPSVQGSTSFSVTQLAISDVCVFAVEYWLPAAYHTHRHTYIRIYFLCPLNSPQDQEDDLVWVTGHRPKEKRRYGSKRKEAVTDGSQSSHFAGQT